MVVVAWRLSNKEISKFYQNNIEVSLYYNMVEMDHVFKLFLLYTDIFRIHACVVCIWFLI